MIAPGCSKMDAPCGTPLHRPGHFPRANTQHLFRNSRIVLAAALWAATFTANATTTQVRLSDKDITAIGRKVWRNECGGTIEGLTSWNVGENFASLGIGHFIWYPAGARGPFEESFPKLLTFMQSRGVKLPDWISARAPCPWSSREEFYRAAQQDRMRELRALLRSTVRLQAEFLIQRLDGALPKMLAAAAPSHREKVREQFHRVLNSGAGGAYALVDYVNFKGEGVLESERYNDEGWGLLQVLENMHPFGGGTPVREFAESAREVLIRRVRNAPPERHEERWLPGWKSRVASYAD